MNTASARTNAPSRSRLGCAFVLAALLVATELAAQLPSRAAIASSNEDDAAVELGSALFFARCARCHGLAGRGTNPATDLIRSTLVRHDQTDRKLATHPDKSLTKSQIADLRVWLRVLLVSVAGKGNKDFLNILTGDPKQGEQFFASHCASCHSTKGDLAGIGEKYDPSVLQSLWLNPRRSKTPRTVTVTPPGVSGTLERIDEFRLTLKDQSGTRREIPLDDDTKVDIHDPLQPHYDLYPRLSDADVHNMTAFLATLK